MQIRRRLLICSILSLVGTPAGATDLVACVVAPLPNNPTYYGTATTLTQLKCEFTRQDYYPTLGELYKLGWRLIEVVGGESAFGKGAQSASPLYFLERDQPTSSAPTEAPPQKPDKTPAKQPK